MRNKYTKEFEHFVKTKAEKYTKEQLRKTAEKKFEIIISKNAMEKYLARRKIRCVDYKKHMSRNMYRSPIGTEYKKDDGMILVKVEQPDKWEYKHRIMYMKYHNCKLSSDDYIIFLNQNRNDFSKGNLKKITKKESAFIGSLKMYSEEPKITELGILTAKLIIKTKEKEKENVR